MDKSWYSITVVRYLDYINSPQEMKGTKKCIVCLADAIMHSGHVIDDKNEAILAGWCEDHQDMNIPFFMNKIGCHGGWHKKYGKVKI